MAALDAARRRLYSTARSPLYMTAIRLEGKFAALTDDRAGAIHAYHHYLALRDDPGAHRFVPSATACSPTFTPSSAEIPRGDLLA